MKKQYFGLWVARPDFTELYEVYEHSDKYNSLLQLIFAESRYNNINVVEGEDTWVGTVVTTRTDTGWAINIGCSRTNIQVNEHIE